MFFEFLNFILSKIFFFCSSIGGDTFPKPLSAEDESKYLALFREKGDKNAKELLVKHNLRLVAHVAKKYQGYEDSDDLISTGTIGLIKAINTFNPDKGANLATYTARCIENEILMLLRANKKYSKNVHLSDSIGTDNDGNQLTLMDLLCDDDDSKFSKVESKTENKKLIELTRRILSDREFKIICLRYGLKSGSPLPQREVACFLKISRSYVSRIEKKALEKIKEQVKKEKIFFN